GLAKLLGGDTGGGPATVAGRLLGTPEYMSPEQCTGAAVDHRCDVYSLGCMLFEMIAGIPPFTAGTVRDLLAAHKFRTPPSLGMLGRQAPFRLDQMVRRMLHKEADQRPQTMAEVAAILEAVDEARV